MPSLVYNNFKAKIMDGSIDLDSNTVKVLLVTSTYSPNIDSHTTRNDVTNEVSGTGYTSGGATLAGLSVTVDNTNDWGKWDANDVTWSSSTITARAAVVYKSTGSASTDLLICYVDFGSDQTSSSGDFTIQWSANGILTLS